ncbi:hypothetical protein BCR43DRAFT_486838 [Syncephalastrum racemosum]|uniref:Uncharacterized protein n=1 Tax=Syncephalastrum racemosum TaxID=13706 RepID=A0A1X2HPV0_SYNRA|nr:hypothetical protein BCR43DRAFT_486838 [Syncephalastrum racemosum]
MGKNAKITLKLDTPLLKKTELAKKEAETPTEKGVEKMLAFVFCLRIYDELIRTPPEERRLLKSKMLWQRCLPKHIFEEAALWYHAHTAPVTAHSVKLTIASPLLVWRQTVKQQFNHLYKRALNTYKKQKSHPWSIECVRVPLSDVLRDDLPEKEKFIASLENVTHSLPKDASVLADAIEAMLLHYAGHGLDNDVTHFRPETMIPHRDQIRNTDELVVDVKPLDMSRLKPLIAQSMEHRDFLSFKHLKFIHVRLLPLEPARAKTIERPFWSHLLSNFDASSLARQTLVGFTTFRCATQWVKEGIDAWWFGGVVFQRSLHGLCQVLLWLHLAPAEEKQIFAQQPALINCRHQDILENETTFIDYEIQGKANDPAQLPLPLRSRYSRILWLTEQLKTLIADSTVVGPLSLAGVRSRIENATSGTTSGTNSPSSLEKEQEIRTLHTLVNLLRPYTPQRHIPYHPLLHVPFVVMANAVLHTAGYKHLVQPLYPPHTFDALDDDAPLSLQGETMYEIFCGRRGPYRMVDPTGTAIAKSTASFNADSILHTFFDHQRLTSIYERHNLHPLPGIYPLSGDHVVLKGFSTKITERREFVEEEE